MTHRRRYVTHEMAQQKYGVRLQVRFQREQPEPYTLNKYGTIDALLGQPVVPF